MRRPKRGCVRIALALEGSRETRRRMKVAGVDVRTHSGGDLP
jgi:hypothetical protein